MGGKMSNPEEPGYQQFEGVCRTCARKFTYHNSVKRHTEVCQECEEAKHGWLSGFTYLFTLGYSLDIFGYGCLRVGIDHNTGEQILGYVATERKARNCIT